MSTALKPIVIIGAGGHAKDVASIIEDLDVKACEWDLLGFLDTQSSGREEHHGYRVLAGYEAVIALCQQPFFVCGMGRPPIRLKESLNAEARGWIPATLVHPSVIQGRFVSIGPGSTIGPGCVLGPSARIGRHCVINTLASVHHDASVGDFSVISPGARILGNVVLEQGVFIGANASVHPGRRIGNSARLGANAFLRNDLEAGKTAFGVLATTGRAD